MERNIEKFNNLLYFSLFSIYYSSVNIILYLIIYYNQLILFNEPYNIIFLLITIFLFLISIVLYLNFKNNSNITILLLIYILANFIILFKYSSIVYNILFSISYFLIYYLIYKDLYKILSFFKILKFCKIFNILNFLYFLINILGIFLKNFTIQTSEYMIFLSIYSIILFIILYKNIYILIKKYSTYYVS